MEEQNSVDFLGGSALEFALLFFCTTRALATVDDAVQYRVSVSAAQRREDQPETSNCKRDASTCKVLGGTCTSASQCCGALSTCDGSKCKAGVPPGGTCSRNTQCRRGYLCIGLVCKV